MAKNGLFCVGVLCDCFVVNGNGVYECIAWFYRERMDGREWMAARRE